jgi:hypothetical protein
MEDLDFEVRIQRSYQTYSLCVSYIGNDPLVRRLIQCQILRKDDYRTQIRPTTACLFYASITCRPKNFKVKLRDPITEEKVKVLDVQGDAMIHSFYNKTYKYGLHDLPVFQKLKGIGQRMLCLLLQTAVHDGALKINSHVVLEASGSLQNKEMIGLVENYKRLGFEVIYPEWFKLSLQNEDVPMRATVRRVLNLCSTPDNNPVSRQLVKDAKQGEIDEEYDV